MTSSRCNGICDRHRLEWKPALSKEIRASEAGRYTNAMLCRSCSVWVDIAHANGIGKNRCPCCNNLMRSRRLNSRTKKAQTLGYDPRDKKRM